jgi:hypothetical protein
VISDNQRKRADCHVVLVTWSRPVADTCLTLLVSPYARIRCHLSPGGTAGSCAVRARGALAAIVAARKPTPPSKCPPALSSVTLAGCVKEKALSNCPGSQSSGCPKPAALDPDMSATRRHCRVVGPGCCAQIACRRSTAAEATIQASDHHGVPSTLRAFAAIESGGNPRARREAGQVHQLSHSEFRKYGAAATFSTCENTKWRTCCVR